MRLLLAASLLSPALAQQPPDFEVLASDLGGGTFTGQVAVDGDRVLATYFDGTSHAYVLEPGPGGWSVVDELVPTNAGWTGQRTTCVALDGDHALVGYGRAQRAAFFERGPGGWTQTEVVIAPSGTFASSFATAAAIEGEHAIVGVSSNVNHRNFVYRRVGGAWVQTQTLGVGRLTDVEIVDGLVVLGNGFRNGAIQGHSSAISGRVSIARILPSGEIGPEFVLPGPPGWDLLEGRLGMSVATDGTFVSATWSGHPGAWVDFEMDESWIVTWKNDGTGWVVDSTYAHPGNTGNTDRIGHGLAWDGSQLVTGFGGFGHWAALREDPAGGWAAAEFLHASSSLTVDHRTLDARPGLIAGVAGGSPIGLVAHSGRYERLVLWGSPVGDGYCTAQPNSTGRTARLYASGSSTVADDGLTLGAVGLPPGALTLPIVGGQQGFATNPGGSQGDLCLGAPFGRFVQLAAAADLDGRFSSRVSLTTPLPGIGTPVQAGETWYFQAWYRDANPSTTSNFTDARAVTFD